MKTISTNLTDKKDMINAQNSSAVLKDMVGQALKMHGFVIYSEVDSNGNEQVVTAIKTDNGFVGSTSSNVRGTVEGVADVYTPEEFATGIDFVVRSSKSKNGRDFLTLELV